MIRSPVAFINMPFFPSDRPSLGLSLLKSALAKKGIDSDIHYLNIPFTAKIGVDIAQELNDCPRVDLVGEWVFAEAAWGPDSLNDTAYLTNVIEKKSAEHKIYPSMIPSAEMKEKLLFCRNQVNNFLDRCLSEIPWKQYRIVGFSSQFHQQLASLTLAGRLKETHPHIFIVFGGANCIEKMGESLFRNFSFIDALFMGEADEIFPDFAAEYLKSGRIIQKPGILLRNARKRQSIHIQRVPNLDLLPDPDFDDFFQQRLRHSDLKKEDLLLMIESSRGCWWGEKSHCLFCGVNDRIMNFRIKSPQKMIGEIDRLIARYGKYSHFLVTTDCCLPMKHLRSTIPKLAEKSLGIRLFYETKVNLKKDHVQIMRHAGIQEMQPGIESFSSSILKRIRKGQTRLQNIQLLKWCAEFGIIPNWNYIYGFPGEQPEDYSNISNIIRMITHLQPPIKEGRVRFDRFSPYQTNPSSLGISRLKPYPSYRHIFPKLDPQSIHDLAYYFVADFEGEDRIAEWSGEIKEAVLFWKEQAHRSSLFFIDDNTKMLICDFRPGVLDSFQVFQGPQRTLYKACDRIRSRSVLRNLLKDETGTDIDEKDLDNLLNPILKHHLMLEEDGFYLSLAVSLDHEYFPTEHVWNRFPEVLTQWDNMKIS